MGEGKREEGAAALPGVKLALASLLVFQRKEAGSWVLDEHRTMDQPSFHKACAIYPACPNQLATENPGKELGRGPAECSLSSWWG